jgi:hypothetical protein
MDYKKNNVSTDMKNGRGNKGARVTRGSRNPKRSKRKHYIVAETTKQIIKKGEKPKPEEHEGMP